MTRFRYEGFNNRSETKRGFVDAENESEAAGKLRDLGLFVQKCEPDAHEPMKQVLPGGEDFPEGTSRNLTASRPKVVFDRNGYSGFSGYSGCKFEPQAPRGADEPWQARLRVRIKSILEVYRFLPEVKKELAGLPPDAAKQAYFEAFNDMLKDAIMDAERLNRMRSPDPDLKLD